MTIRALIVTGWMGLLGANAAWASPITFDFTATVTLVNPALASFFTLNETLTGSYTFESTTAGVPSGAAVDYPALSSFTITGASFTGSWTGGDIFVLDAPGDDEYAVNALTGFSGTATGQPVSPTSGITLLDPTGAMLSSTLLPLTPPTLPGDARAGIDYHLGPEEHVEILATVNSMTLAPSPRRNPRRWFSPARLCLRPPGTFGASSVPPAGNGIAPARRAGVAYNASVSAAFGRHTSSRRSIWVTIKSRISANSVSTRIPASTVSMSNTPSACWMR